MEVQYGQDPDTTVHRPCVIVRRIDPRRDDGRSGPGRRPGSWAAQWQLAGHRQEGPAETYPAGSRRRQERSPEGSRRQGRQGPSGNPVAYGKAASSKGAVGTQDESPD